MNSFTMCNSIAGTPLNSYLRYGYTVLMAICLIHFSRSFEGIANSHHVHPFFRNKKDVLIGYRGGHTAADVGRNGSIDLLI